VIEDVFSAQQKQEMIKKLTDAMVSIEGENMRGVTVGNHRGGEER
jgi:4-oxalocrotonate tautomerase